MTKKFILYSFYDKEIKGCRNFRLRSEGNVFDDMNFLTKKGNFITARLGSNILDSRNNFVSFNSRRHLLQVFNKSKVKNIQRVKTEKIVDNQEVYKGELI